MNSKNQLQEYLVKEGTPPPKYKTKLVGGKPHCPQFQSTVQVHGMKVLGEINKTKKAAEMSAAQQALKILKFSSEYYDTASFTASVPKLATPLPSPVRIYIDLENRANVTDHIKDLLRSSDITVFGFASVTASVLDKDFHKDMKIFRVPSSHSNAADVGMIIRVAYDITTAGTEEAVIVVTADKFGHALVDCIRNFHKLSEGSERVKAVCVSNVTHLWEVLEQYSETGEFNS